MTSLTKTKNYCDSKLIIIWLKLFMKQFLQILLYSCTNYMECSMEAKLYAEVHSISSLLLLLTHQ